jgi:Fe-S-cluster containining protein
MVRIEAEDTRRIAAHLGLGEAAFRSRYLAASGDRLVEGLGGRCPFLEDGREARCTVYPVRPERCRSWPFWPELREGAALGEAQRLCPGISLDPSREER